MHILLAQKCASCSALDCDGIDNNCDGRIDEQSAGMRKKIYVAAKKNFLSFLSESGSDFCSVAKMQKRVAPLTAQTVVADAASHLTFASMPLLLLMARMASLIGGV